MKSVFIATIGENETVDFAVSELKRLLPLLSITATENEEAAQLRVGVDLAELPVVKERALDDAIAIHMDRLNGVITGSNPRSVLIAAYRFLHELGLWFPRPDCVLARPVECDSLHICEKAAYRHRGFCIEGAVSFDQILSFVQWMPTQGFNSYFTQFLTPYEFFKCWYAHARNPLLENTEPVPTPEAVNTFTYGPLARELHRRGLIFHATGHGWTTQAVGVSGLGWDKTEQPVAKRYETWLAEIDGRRAFFHNQPLNTNLCYSAPSVQEALTDTILHFLAEHPQVDVLHFWLADDYNNSCECPQCQMRRPADWYLDMLNLLDEKLTQAGLPTRVVLLAYMDLLWPPLNAHLHNPQRFLFMFAPISRTYSSPLPLDASGNALPPFTRNHLTLPSDVSENIAFLKAWQDVVSCDSFIYEYHYMWDCYKDISDYENAKTLHEDVRRLRALGLNGYISCQQTRIFSPCGFGMYVLGQALWNDQQDFSTLADQYYNALFGQEKEKMQRIFQTVSQFMPPQCLRGEKPLRASAKSLLSFVKQATQRQSELTTRLCSCSGAQAVIWQGVCFWNGLCIRYAYWLEAIATNNGEANARLQALKEYVQSEELCAPFNFDAYWFLKTLETQIQPVL